MKENYKAWDINIDHFHKLESEYEKLKFLLKFAVLAPSSHNTQPWRFSIKGNKIFVYKETLRRLKVADVEDRQLVLSIGCAIENILLAADYYGYRTEINIEPNQNESHLLVTIEFFENNHLKKDINHLINFIVSRKTNRNEYLPKSISQSILIDIQNTILPNLHIYITDNKSKIENLGQIAILSSIESFIDKSFRHELSHHVKHNLTKSKVGMPGFAQGIPTPISFLLPSLIKRFNMEKANQKNYEVLFKKHTPYIGIITVGNDDQTDWINAGRTFEKISLICTRSGISISPWGAPIEVGYFHKEITQLINIPGRPVMFFRLGYSEKGTKISPRMPIEEVIK
jgi:hypothetical protein